MRIGALVLPLVVAGSVVAGSVACDVSVNDKGVSLGIARGRAQDEWGRTYTLGPAGRLEVHNVNGSIDVTPADTNQVEVRAERIASAVSDEAARELLRTLRMSEEVAVGRVRIEAQPSPGGPSRMGRRSTVEIRYHVRVPAGLSMAFETANGTIRIENVQGQIVASSTNGAVSARAVNGPLKASTTNGGIQIDLSAITGDVDVQTANGTIRLGLPANGSATLDARCINGGVVVDDRLPLRATQSSRQHVAGTLNGGGAQITASTINGAIRIVARGAL
jgi:DUF4097 and DUF4098 domain-containing protein YvlB